MFRVVSKLQREGLAAELVEALFSGLPRLDKRVAVFLAAGDESDGPEQRGPFVYGGFVAPVRVWIDSFTPAWEKHVLNTDPPIPHLHMVDIRKPAWRERYGLTGTEAELRVDAAAAIIAAARDVRPIKTEFDGGHFRDVFGTTKLVKVKKQTSFYRLEPDYVAFLGFCYAALDMVKTFYSDAEKVDFLVEHKTTVSSHRGDFYDNLADSLRKKGRGDLVHLIGELHPSGGKDRVPLQAADVAVWHWRRYACRQCDDADFKRLGWMFNGRHMMVNGMTTEQISAMGLRSKKNAVQNPLKPKVKLC